MVNCLCGHLPVNTTSKVPKPRPEPLWYPCLKACSAVGEPVTAMPPSGSGYGWGDESGNEDHMGVDKGLDCQQGEMSISKANDFLAGMFAIFLPALWMLSSMLSGLRINIKLREQDRLP